MWSQFKACQSTCLTINHRGAALPSLPIFFPPSCPTEVTSHPVGSPRPWAYFPLCWVSYPWASSLPYQTWLHFCTLSEGVQFSKSPNLKNHPLLTDLTNGAHLQNGMRWPPQEGLASFGHSFEKVIFSRDKWNKAWWGRKKWGHMWAGEVLQCGPGPISGLPASPPLRTPCSA